MLLCVAAVGVLLWLAYSVRLAQLSAQLRSQLEGRISERERIARELHDTLLQGFQGLMLRFQSVANTIPSDQPARALLESAMKRGDAALLEGRNRVRDLRSFETVDDLAKTLGSLSANSPHADNVVYRVTERGHPRTLDPITIDEVVKISAEAVLNAFKHAQATAIDVAIVYEHDAIHILIEDDGIGIAPAILEAGRREGHYGLIGMGERARKISAKLGFARGASSGTTIEIIVPAAVAYTDPPGSRWGFGIWQIFRLRWLRRSARR